MQDGIMTKGKKTKKAVKKAKKTVSKKKVVKKKKPRKKTGRPTLYKKSRCTSLIKFFGIEPWDKDGKYVRMPTLEGYAKHIKVSISTVYDWINEKHGSYQPEFSEAFARARALRTNWLVDVGLSGLAPPNSFKFVAVNVTDMRDKNETAHDVTDKLKSVLDVINGSTKGVLPQNDDRDSSKAS